MTIDAEQIYNYSQRLAPRANSPVPEPTCTHLSVSWNLDFHKELAVGLREMDNLQALVLHNIGH